MCMPHVSPEFSGVKEVSVRAEQSSKMVENPKSNKINHQQHSRFRWVLHAKRLVTSTWVQFGKHERRTFTGINGTTFPSGG